MDSDGAQEKFEELLVKVGELKRPGKDAVASALVEFSKYEVFILLCHHILICQ